MFNVVGCWMTREPDKILPPFNVVVEGRMSFFHPFISLGEKPKFHVLLISNIYIKPKTKCESVTNPSHPLQTHKPANLSNGSKDKQKKDAPFSFFLVLQFNVFT